MYGIRGGVLAGLIAGAVVGVPGGILLYMLSGTPDHPVPFGVRFVLFILGPVVLGVLLGAYLGTFGGFEYREALAASLIAGFVYWFLLYPALLPYVRYYMIRPYGIFGVFLCLFLGVATCWVFRRLCGPPWDMD